MTIRIFTAVLVALIVFPICYGAWLYGINLIPPEFGMPEYEEQIEWALVVGSVAFSAVPLYVSIRVSRFLNRPLESGA